MLFTYLTTQNIQKAVYDALDCLESLEAGANPPVDAFPFLKYIPDRFAAWKRRAKDSFKCIDGTWNRAREIVDARRARGLKRTSIIDSILDGEKHSDLQITNNQLNHLLGVLVEGGSETTASATLTSLMHLALHPEVQAKAQNEIDAVCGTERYMLIIF
jgi:cytochrome P450